jgi:hypothetical protein
MHPEHISKIIKAAKKIKNLLFILLDPIYLLEEMNLLPHSQHILASYCCGTGHHQMSLLPRNTIQPFAYKQIQLLNHNHYTYRAYNYGNLRFQHIC